jgi:EAL domain-containing protein (putative c-di-GMP-specific phosphodiesterase class I)
VSRAEDTQHKRIASARVHRSWLSDVAAASYRDNVERPAVAARMRELSARLRQGRYLGREVDLEELTYCYEITKLWIV